MKDLFLFIFLICVVAWFSLMHEKDMYNNCLRTGNAKAWVFEIKCEGTKE